jgi:hypothetical protein
MDKSACLPHDMGLCARRLTNSSIQGQSAELVGAGFPCSASNGLQQQNVTTDGSRNVGSGHLRRPWDYCTFIGPIKLL